MNKQELIAAIEAWPDKMVELEEKWSQKVLSEWYDDEKNALYEEAVMLMFDAQKMLVADV